MKKFLKWVLSFVLLGIAGIAGLLFGRKMKDDAKAIEDRWKDRELKDVSEFVKIKPLIERDDDGDIASVEVREIKIKGVEKPWEEIEGLADIKPAVHYDFTYEEVISTIAVEVVAWMLGHPEVHPYEVWIQDGVYKLQKTPEYKGWGLVWLVTRTILSGGLMFLLAFIVRKSEKELAANMWEQLTALMRRIKVKMTEE